MADADRVQRPLSPSVRYALAALTALIFIFLFMPLVIVIILSFSPLTYLAFPPPGFSWRWYQSLASSQEWLHALWSSFKVGIPVAMLSAALGICSALVAARAQVFWRAGFAALVAAPMMVPHIILAIGIYPLMVDVRLTGTFAAIVLAHTVIAMPFVFITVRSSLQGYSPSLELAAMTLGATWWVSFRRVTLPMILPGVVVGTVFAFTASFDELMLSLFLTTPETNTLPRVIWAHLAYQVSPDVAAVATLVLLFSCALMAMPIALRRRGAKLELNG
ncbi:MAG: ABC transporter permease [Proteobacteria bacterium]|nr:ABC transporter permease [Pseudomonadota bacterium]